MVVYKVRHMGESQKKRLKVYYNSSHWNRNKNNSSVMMIDNHQRQNEIKTQEQFPTQKVGNFIYNGVYMYMIIYIYIPLLTKEMSCKKLEILGLMLCLLLLVRN